jgi:hypothetical protein
MIKYTRQCLIRILGLSLILAFAMLFLSACVKNGEVLIYTINGTEVVINRCDADATDAEVADDFTAIAGRGYTVTSIDARAFYNCSGLTSVNIPDTVTSIGDWAFLGCASLTSVNIPVGVTIISDLMFKDCFNLANINISDTVTSIGSSAFLGCLGLKSIDIPDGVTSIGKYAFSRCSGLESLNIPAGVKSISESAFSGCTGLTNINIPVGVTSIGNSAFAYCRGLKNVNIPVGVTSIGDSAFAYCTSLTNADIPVGVTNIGDSVFSHCTSLTSVNIPAGVTNIAEGTFLVCTELTSVNIPDSVTIIGDSAFAYCAGLKNVNIPNGVTSIGDSAFMGAGIEEIRIPASVTVIGNDDSSESGSWGKILRLDAIIFNHGRTDIPAAGLKGIFSKPVYVYIPSSVTSVDSTAVYPESKQNFIFRSIAGSYIEEWARDNKVDFEPIRSRITKDAYEARRSVPYQDIIETDTPDNAYLSFELADGALPAGLTLSKDGRLSGVPLETGTFTFKAAVYYSMFGSEKEYPMDLREIELTVN